MVDENEYKRYLEDQITDSITESQYLEQRKKETYKYCNFFFQKLPDIDGHKLKVLDIGCREFFTYDYFMDNFSTTIQGIDVGTAGLEYTAKNRKPAVYLDAHELSSKFADNSFEVIFSFHALEHMYDLAEVELDNYYSGKLHCKVLGNCRFVARHHTALRHQDNYHHHQDRYRRTAQQGMLEY